MRRLYNTFYQFFIVLSLSFVFQNLSAQAPTAASSNLNTFSIDGDRFRVFFTAGNGAKRIIVVKEGSPVTNIPSDGTDYVAGAFGAGNEITPGSGEFIVYEGTGSSNIQISGLDHSTTYFLKIFEFNGSNFSTEYLTSAFLEGNETTLTNPTTQASNITFSNVLGTSMRVDWDAGNGTGRLLIAKAGNPVDVEPQQLVEYSNSSSFGSPSTEIGSGNFVLSDGASTFVNISNLLPGVTYHFAVFEYNGSSGKVYLTSTTSPSAPGATNSETTPTTPTENATGMDFTGVDGDRMRFLFFSNYYGNGAKRLIIAKEGSAVTAAPVNGQSYTANGTFGSGQEITTDEFVVYNGTAGNNILLSNLLPSTTYHFKVFEYNENGSDTFYLTGLDSNNDPVFETSQTTLSPPTTQASNFSFTNITGTSMTVNWDNTGDGNGRLLVAKAGGPVDATPQDFVEYAQSSSFGSASAEIGTDNYVIYDSLGSFVNLTNLQPGVTYHFALFEYTGVSGKQYLTTNPLTGSQITDAFPTENTTAIGFTGVDGDRMRFLFFSSYYGNGAKRLIIAKAGSAVTATPVNGQSYTANGIFGSGQEIAPDEFVVYNGTAGNNSLLSNLQPGTTYHFKVFEYNENGVNTFYLTGPDDNTDPVFETSQATLSAPTAQASNFSFTNITGTAMTVSWDNTGDGSGRLLVAKAGSPVDATPQDFVEYSNNQNGFGSSSNEIGTDNYVLYDSSGSSVNLGNLQPGITYHFALFEYTGSSAKQYLTTNPLTGSQLTEAFPTENTTAMGFTGVDGDRMRFFFFSSYYGNGAKRLIIAKAGSAVTATPVNGQSYTANGSFGDGQEIAPDEFVVYNGTAGNNILVSNLQPGTTYHFKIFEYNENSVNTFYLTGPDNNADPVFETTQSTLSPPTTNSNSAFFNSKTSTSFNLNWTNGDGSNRLLIIRENEPVNVEPQDLTSYFSSSSGFGNAFYEIGTGNYVVYSGGGNSVNVTNLNPGTNYYFELFEFNGSSGKLYLRPGFEFQEQTFGTTPAQQVTNPVYSVITSTSFVVDFTRGDGSHRLVLAKKDSPVDAAPVDLTTYTANTSFGAGDEIGSGNFVVYNDTGEDFQLNNLDPSSTYHLAFFEYAISATGELYLTPGLPSSQSTDAPPCASPTNVNVSSINNTSAFFSWDPVATATNGFDYYIVSDSSVPDGTTTPTGTTVAGENSLLLTNLVEGTTYDFYVRSNCDNTNLSDWSTVVNFSTLTDCYVANYSGNGNTGFLGPVGQSTLTFEDDGTTITGTFTKGSANFDNEMVIYIDSKPGGFASTINFDDPDSGDILRRAIAGFGGFSASQRSVVNFPTGFEADYAIGINTTFGGLWELVNNASFPFITAVGNPVNNSQSTFTFTFDWSEIGITNKDEFSFVITYLNGFDIAGVFRSDEAYGNGVSSGNPGTNGTITFTSSESYPKYFYVFDGSTWSPSDPDGVNEPCRRALIQSGSDTFTSSTTLDAIRINPQAVLDINANLSADLIFKSDATGSGQLDDATGNIVSGQAIVERYMSPNRAFRFVASPVGGSETIRENWQEGATTSNYDPSPGYGTHITGQAGTAGNISANGFDETSTGNHSIFRFDNTIGDYETPNLSSTDIPLNGGDTYALLVRGDRSINLNSNTSAGSTTLRATGNLNFGTKSSGTDFPALNQNADGYSLAPNPYQAIVDACEMTRTNLNDSFVVRRVNSTFGDWLEIDLSTTGAGLCSAAPAPGPGSDDSRFIPPGIAFFVQTATNAAASIEFNEDDKATDNAALTTVFSETDLFYLNARLYTIAELQNGDMERDAFGLRFDSQFTTPADPAEDIAKFVNDAESIAVNNNGLQAIDKQGMPNLGDVIQLETSGYTTSQYSLLFMMENAPNGIGVFINDAYLGTQTEISDGFVFDFTVDPNIPESIAADRFSLVFDNTTLGVEDNSFGANFSLYPNPVSNGSFSIRTPGLSGEVSLEISNILGQNVSIQTLQLTGNEVEVDAKGLAGGVYLVKLLQNDQSYTTKVFIE